MVEQVAAAIAALVGVPAVQAALPARVDRGARSHATTPSKPSEAALFR